MNEFTIGKVVTRTGLPASTIRYYESVGVVPKPARKNGRRQYNENWLKKLSLVMLAQNGGFTIKEIKRILQQFGKINSSPSKRWMKVARTKLATLEEQKRQISLMQQVLKMAMSCNCCSLEDCANYAYQHLKA